MSKRSAFPCQKIGGDSEGRHREDRIVRLLSQRGIAGSRLVGQSEKKKGAWLQYRQIECLIEIFDAHAIGLAQFLPVYLQ